MGIAATLSDLILSDLKMSCPGSLKVTLANFCFAENLVSSFTEYVWSTCEVQNLGTFHIISVTDLHLRSHCS